MKAVISPEESETLGPTELFCTGSPSARIMECEQEKMAVSTIFFMTSPPPPPPALTVKTWDPESVTKRNEGGLIKKTQAQIISFVSSLMTPFWAERDPKNSKAPGLPWSLVEPGISKLMVPLLCLPRGYQNSTNPPNRTGPVMTWSPESLDSVLLGRFLCFSSSLFSWSLVSGKEKGESHSWTPLGSLGCRVHEKEYRFQVTAASCHTLPPPQPAFSVFLFFSWKLILR